MAKKIVPFTPIIETWEMGEPYEGIVLRIRTNPSEVLLRRLQHVMHMPLDQDEGRAKDCYAAMAEVVVDCNIEGVSFETAESVEQSLSVIDRGFLTSIFFFILDRQTERLKMLRSFQPRPGGGPVSGEGNTN